MLLKTYLEQNEIDHEKFAKKANASVHGLKKWLRGERIPRPKTIRRIAKITNGEVTAQDFFSEAAA